MTDPTSLLRLNAEVEAGVPLEEAAVSVGLLSPKDPLILHAIEMDDSECGGVPGESSTPGVRVAAGQAEAENHSAPGGAR